MRLIIFLLASSSAYGGPRLICQLQLVLKFPGPFAEEFPLQRLPISQLNYWSGNTTTHIVNNSSVAGRLTVKDFAE